MKILGLDIGTTSIGWAIIEEGKENIDTGVQIFFVGAQFRALFKNKKAPHCKARQGLNVFTTE